MPLTTYTASAGAGKTHALTREYLQLVLSQSASSAVYRQLLAITFTNKAADEMKSRIIERLHNISTGNDSNAYNDFCIVLNITAYELQQRASDLLSTILHDYSHFAISTIDAFFQKIVRAFLREMGLLPTFALELDSNYLLDEAINALWQDAAINEPLRKRLITLTNKRIEQGKSWNVRDELKKIGGEIFKESFHCFGSGFIKKIGDAQFLNNYEHQLQTFVADFKKNMQKIGSQALSVLAEHNFTPADFKYKTSSFANYFVKLVCATNDKDYKPSLRVVEAMGDEKKWMTGNTEKDIIVSNIIFPAANPLLEQAISYYQEQYTTYRTMCEILKNLYGMALLADISGKVTAITGDKNMLLISDTLHLLRTMISDNDTPFVYEKAGVYYQSFMLDEFQDTSNMQWESLRPLLFNGLSEGGKVLAVGDVKQSIYRWRNGDWRILAHRLPDYFLAYGTEKIVLDTNWRSKEVIVNFNNEIFSRLPLYLQQNLNEKIDAADTMDLEHFKKLRTVISDAYHGSVQKIAPSKINFGGFVRVQTVYNDEEGMSAKEKVLQALPQLVAKLQDRGYSASDIAILVRYGREGQEIADALLQHKQTVVDTYHCFDVISQDSLYLFHAPVVQFIIALFNMAVMPDDNISKAIANRYLQRFVHGKTIDKAFLTKLVYLPLNEAIENIIAHFQLNENKTNWAYLQDLHDIIINHANRERNDIFSFVMRWKEKGNSDTLSMTDNHKAVKILTIHKSKGLQFPVVIIPFCNWDIEPKTQSLLWVKTGQEPFSGPGYLPLNYSGALSETFFNADYWEERVQAAIDNLNLLYVAFTRAEEELYAFVPQKFKNNNSFAQILPELLQTDNYEAGAQQPKTISDKFNSVPTVALQAYHSLNCKNNLLVQYDDKMSTNITNAGIRDYGILLHRAFSYINTTQDINTAVEKLIEHGYLTNDEKQRQIIIHLLNDALRQYGVQEWFDGSFTMLAETDLLLPSDGSYVRRLRPDRVMYQQGKIVVVDYKFGKNKLSEHHNQVKNYIANICKTGNVEVEGYCWYVTLRQIEKVIN